MSKYRIFCVVMSIFGIGVTEKEYKTAREKQRIKGFTKYGMYLEEQADDALDWRKEMIEEAVDLIEYFGKYLKCKNNKKKEL